MRYTDDEFQELIGGVEEVGGIHMDEACKPTKFRLRFPRKSDGKVRWHDLWTTGCNRKTKFLIPYATPQGRLGDRMLERGAGLVTVCARDDNVGAWPRVQKAMQEASQE